MSRKYTNFIGKSINQVKNLFLEYYPGYTLCICNQKDYYLDVYYLNTIRVLVVDDFVIDALEG